MYSLKTYERTLFEENCMNGSKVTCDLIKIAENMEKYYYYDVREMF